jgi:hypothetical protein
MVGQDFNCPDNDSAYIKSNDSQGQDPT